MDKIKISWLRTKINSLLDEFAKENKLKIQCGNATFSADSCTIKVDVVEVSENNSNIGNVRELKDRTAYKEHCSLYGLPVDGLDKQIKAGNKVYTIIGLHPRYAKPVICKDADGRNYKFDANVVASLLACKI